VKRVHKVRPKKYQDFRGGIIMYNGTNVKLERNWDDSGTYFMLEPRIPEDENLDTCNRSQKNE